MRVEIKMVIQNKYITCKSHSSELYKMNRRYYFYLYFIRVITHNITENANTFVKIMRFF